MTQTSQTADRDAGSADAPVSLPFAYAEPGDLVEVAPGILWARLPLAYQPGHVNTYLIDEGDGWCAVDAGLLDADTMAAWDRVIAGLPHHPTIKNVLITHWHSDHLGAAGWLCDRFDAPLLMSEAEFSKALLMEFLPRGAANAVERGFFHSHGLPDHDLEQWVAHGHDYLRMAAPLPHVYRRLIAGDRLTLGRRDFRIGTVAGHSPEEIMLCAEDGDVFLCADQLGPKISPTVAVQSNDPLGDPLRSYLRSLDWIAAARMDGALILPGHEAPFRGLATRMAELKAYYQRRCDIVEAACASGPKTGRELVGELFRNPPSPVWIGFVTAEAITYANHLVGQKRLVRKQEGSIIRFATA